mmetsp:Transcript_15465/g.26607  ORF Transcript_15465/g.26607 Transcript_15465/m.26607 type:complete len:101 (-) Transcript_15465:1010-1312(-)
MHRVVHRVRPQSSVWGGRSTASRHGISIFSAIRNLLPATFWYRNVSWPIPNEYWMNTPAWGPRKQFLLCQMFRHAEDLRQTLWKLVPGMFAMCAFRPPGV